MITILIIDDSEEWREGFLRRPLLKLGCGIETAANHKEALGLLDGKQFDLVILDVRLDPQIKETLIPTPWIELLDKIKQTNAEIIVVTARAFPPPIELADLMRLAFRDFQVKDFLIKESFNPRDYRQSVQDIINAKRTSNPGLTHAEKAILQSQFANLPQWKLGQHQDRIGVLIAAGIPDSYVLHLTLYGEPGIAAALTINALSAVGYIVGVPEYTGLGLLIKYLYENSHDIEGKTFCAGLLINHQFTKDEIFLQEVKANLPQTPS